MDGTSIHLAAEAPVAGGELLFRPPAGRRGLACWLALPNEVAPGKAPLVAVHGIHRGAEAQARAFAARAFAEGRPVIAPLFDQAAWPAYQQVVRKGRADLALLALLDDLRAIGVCGGRRIALAGYSGGGQFAHRFAMLYPHMIERLTVTSAGWFTFPAAAPFPYGHGPAPKARGDWGTRMAAGLGRFLELPVAVCVGALDDQSDPTLRHRPDLDLQQGTNRVARARAWAETLRSAAGARGIAARVTFSLLPGCGHDFGDCVTRGGLDRIVLPQGAAGPDPDSR